MWWMQGRFARVFFFNLSFQKIKPAGGAIKIFETFFSPYHSCLHPEAGMKGVILRSGSWIGSFRLGCR